MSRISIFVWIYVLAISTIAALNWRPLWSDGAIWIYEIIKEGDFFLAPPYFRYFTYIPQLPAVLYAKFAAQISFPTALTLFSLGYGLINVFWFTIGNIYLWSKNRTDLVWVNILLYLGIVLSSQTFFVSVVGDTTSFGILIFWMLALENKTWRLVFLALTSVALRYGYEMSFLFFFLYGFLFLVKRVDAGRRIQIGLVCFYILIGIASSLEFVWKTFQLDKNHANGVLQDIMTIRPEYFSLLSILVSIGFPLLVFDFEMKKKFGWLAVSLIAIVGSYEFYDVNLMQYYMSNYFARTTLVPKAIIALGVLALIFRFDCKISMRKVRACVLIFLGFWTYAERINNSMWLKGSHNLESFLQNNTGCLFLEKGYASKSLEKYGFLDWVLPYTSVLFQFTGHPESIIFTNRLRPPTYSRTNIIKNPCQNRIGDHFIYEGPFDVYVLPGKNITFDKIKTKGQ